MKAWAQLFLTSHRTGCPLLCYLVLSLCVLGGLIAAINFGGSAYVYNKNKISPA